MHTKLIKRIARRVSTAILNDAVSGVLINKKVGYDVHGNLLGDYEAFYSHCGIYVFTIEKEDSAAVAYVGKCEGDGRLRQHLTGKNKDGTPLKQSVRTKHRRIQDSIKRGFTVKIHRYSYLDFDKASLSCIELTALVLARNTFAEVFPQESPWIERIG